MSQYHEINWSEGLFLRPQHFQQAEQSRRAWQNQDTLLARPYGWGFAELEIAEAELDAEILSVRSCALRMKDGTWLRVPDNGEVQPREFKRPLDQAGGSLPVFLGLPRRRDREPNTLMPHEESASQTRRFLAGMIERVDENSGDNAQPVEVRKLNPQVLFAGDNMAGYDVVRLGQIVRSGFGESKPTLSPQFVPPLLDLAAWPHLFESVRDLYHQLFAKNRGLASQIVGRKVSFSGEGAGGPETLLRLNITNRHTAYLRQLTNLPGIHPFDMYLELCRMAGDLAVFDAERAVPDIPLYDHEDLGRCFGELLATLSKLINLLMPTTFVHRRFEQAGDFLQVALDENWLAPGVEFYLAIESDQEPEAIDREKRFLKMASADDLPRLVQRRLTGLVGQRLQRVPVGLPDRPDLHYYLVHREGEYWEQAVASRTLACQGLNDEGLGLYLYVLLKTDKEG